jgi:hypothetical protein
VVLIPLVPLLVVPIHVLGVPDRKLMREGREGRKGEMISP